ncbi:MAG: DUF4359 domain-containing protein [Nitrospira sp.]|nr:DUF4359 domain-containing protein [Nitrospira sp.]
MKLWLLLLLVTALTASVALVLTNPSLDDYVTFVEAELGKALDRHESSAPQRERDMVRTIFRLHSRELVESVVRPHTIQRNWGLFSLFETTALEVHIEVLAIGGRFIPLKGVDDAVIRLGRLAF